MRNKLTLLLMLLQFYAFTQNCNTLENYDMASNWTIESLNSTGNSTTPTISIANGTFNYEQTPDDWNVIRAYRPLGYTLCNSWQTEFIFNPTGVNDDQLSAGHIIFTATAGSLAPLRVVDQNTSTLVQTDQDAIGVFFRSNGTRFDLEMVPFLKNGTDWITTNCAIPLNGSQTIGSDVSYRVRLERINKESGRLTVFKLMAGEEELLGTCCFNIPLDIEGLNVIQHANATGGHSTRIISGTIDDLCIQNCFKRESCCVDKEIMGNSVICTESGDDYNSDIFSVTNNPDASYTWTLPQGIVIKGQGTSSISVLDWKGYTGEVEVKVLIECGCDTTELSMTVTILNDLTLYGSFDLNTSTSSSSVASCTATPHVTSPADVIHWWNVYEAENCDPNDFSILNESTTGIVALRSPQTTPTAQFNSPEQGWANLETGKCYVIVHRVNYENEVCEWIERRALISVSTQRSGAPQIVLISEETKKIENPSLGFKVYPNPSDSFIRLEQLGDEKTEKVQVFGINGIQKKVAIKGEQINISNLKQGVYLIKLHTNRGIYTQQFIKK
ncbi:T9SS type A sorting domain-containing protein [Tenacibaculum singaporense]|uniref:T9SS type A sorting domain-containing protein n=1 Tax=Tenacibaculum singaporense TaxID=2358479 RepID=UPI000F68CD23|nr:T9SS type A sorting domain-containing protein [Tenacibaculum singaporense]RSC93039.1 T9SS C-terminal target domain-containing protein [Tenacibaculum singaporense]